ncbi:phosphatase PAP2 family protein [uncultured Adlercreutzia sp.]|uniref:phosphatase PAP2 family protein n=1 Tax=uncultured Adlercreutzia sp. TaxID=875803 RepID=UPI0026F39B1C|nr:phosphatase PAP2 family protein [uncultured Adlercreutzia sp.]
MSELAILDAIQTIHVGWLDTLVAAFTSLGNAGALFIFTGLVLCCIPRTRKLGVAVLVAIALGALVTNLTIKPLLMRPRPCDVNPDIIMLVPRPHGSSFPSGHTTAAFACAGALLFMRDPRTPRALAITALIVAILMGLSRLYCYVHYPTDVLAGCLIGLAAGFAAARIVEAAARRRADR